jgi:hypothetical protein
MSMMNNPLETVKEKKRGKKKKKKKNCLVDSF